MRQYHHYVYSELLSELSAPEQRSIMEEWFRSHYEDPANSTPYESREGGYQYIWGGPYRPKDVLEEEFGEIVPEAVIKGLADDLEGEFFDWAPIPKEEDYDESLYESVEDNVIARATFSQATDILEKLLANDPGELLRGPYYGMLFANVITVLETYLSDRFINAVLADSSLLRKFIEGSPEFRDRSLKYADVFKAAEEAKDETKKYLLDTVWHNLAKVQGMYTSTLGIKLNDGMSVIGPAIPKRHDLVHRNGRTKDGKEVTIAANDVQELLTATKALVGQIDADFTRLHPASDF